MTETLRRKRKDFKPSSSDAGSHQSGCGDFAAAAARQIKRKCHVDRRRSAAVSGETGGIAMTSPPALDVGSAARGLKRKLGCIESVTRIGRRHKLGNEYEVGREIGQGKFGSVRICTKRSNGKEFACKTLPKNGEDTAHREVEIMQHLSGHPGVVHLEAVFEDKDSFHLVMELCPGGRLLDQMVKEGRYSEQRAANLMKELLMVIQYCHEMGVVHRDIKPENILLTAEGKMKVADFGLAVRVASGQKLSGLAGSPAYVAPEVLSGQYSEKVDIWGAGVLLHALLVGVLPFQGNSLEDVFEAIKNMKLDFNTGQWESISGLARDLISRMLTRDVSTRMAADNILKHPWILFYTECPSKVLLTRTKVIVPRIELERVATLAISSIESSSQKSEEADDSTGLVDVLAAAISRVRISEPKRTRLCVPASPIQQECSSNMKTNLCTAF